MKAYKIKITLNNSVPEVWRKVIIPSEITFEELHHIIQNSMGWCNNHLYDFNINEENLRVTCDEEAIYQYKFYSKMKLTDKNDPHGHIANMIKIKHKLSDEVKIDAYLTKWKKFEYVYDFGDYWKHNIMLEEIVEDYEYNHPTCIKGQGPCPPEDIGGIYGYIDFVQAINDSKHPNNKTLKQWADDQCYKYIFDIKDVNICLKDIKAHERK